MIFGEPLINDRLIHLLDRAKTEAERGNALAVWVLAEMIQDALGPLPMGPAFGTDVDINNEIEKARKRQRWAKKTKNRRRKEQQEYQAFMTS